jgi:hypothetical protein
MKEYNEIMNEKEKLMPKQVDRYNFLNEKEKTADEKENKIIPGLSVERLTDLEYLENLATEVQSKLVELNQSQTKKYFNKQQKSELEVKFFSFYLYCQFGNYTIYFTILESVQRKNEDERRIAI